MEQQMWTIKRALDWTCGFLAEKGCENAKASAVWLIGDVSNLSRLDIYMNLERPLSDDELSLLHDYVKRRAMGEPLQYISGKAPFRHIVLKVRRGVLVPRPETEVLVSELLSRLPEPERVYATDSAINEYGEPLRGASRTEETQEAARRADGQLEGAVPPAPRARIKVADLCTGSACIACSLAYEHPDIDVVATDISPEAVSLARENVCELGLAERVDVLECDLGSGIGQDLIGCLDAVVSNPPYVPSGLFGELSAEVTDFEPRVALDGGADGLDVFRRIAKWSLSALKPAGVLAVELYEDSLYDAKSLAEAMGFQDIRIANDLAGRPRVLTACSPTI